MLIWSIYSDNIGQKFTNKKKINICDWREQCAKFRILVDLLEARPL